MKNKINTVLFILMGYFTIYAQQDSIGIFPYHEDIGNPKLDGAVTYNSVEQNYEISGSGYNIWFERDELQYAYSKSGKNFIFTANFKFIGEGKDPHRKTGIMVRKSSSEGAAHFTAALHGDGLTSMQWRSKAGEEMKDPDNEFKALKTGYEILQVEKRDSLFIMRGAHFGEPLQEIGSKVLSELSGEVLLGIIMSAHDESVIEKAKVWNLRIDYPVAENYNPYESGWIGCRMETMNVQTGERKVIYKKSDRFEAPNWMPNGEHLLFNMDGSLHTIPVGGGKITSFNTGSAKDLNNDHGISFDGKLLAISNHKEDENGTGSAVFVLPISGGEPKLITPQTPSYWHGWSPNNKDVVYVATRENNPTYDVYKKSIDGGEEIALTNTGAGEHVDGCEYSPDGNYIYYNGSASGTMQIWRMKPDGSAKEQITFDENNDWFPHISPDGKWIVFISFPPTIPVNDHPSFKRVELKLMPAEGGIPKTIAYLYGGQGTINVPSWSPDSKFIAFVSNSGE